LRDADWIEPAVASWQWWSAGAPKLEDQKWWVDKTAEMGLKYYLIDDGWRSWKSPDKNPWELLEQVVEYARSRGVNILIWTDNRYVTEPVSRWAFMSMAKQTGVKGFKIDFMDSESRDMVNWYDQTLADAARLQMMVNFHGAFKPTGRSRTWPNEMTREGVRGLEYNKWDKLPLQHYASLPFTRFVAGHGDFTPVTFDPARVKGTTFAFQLATAIIYTSPQLHLADRLDRYLESPALPLIKALRSTWDKTLVLEGSRIGELAAFARQNGDDWMAAAINAGGKTAYTLDLGFLEEGRFNAFIVKDNAGKRPELVVEEVEVSAGDRITFELLEGGGFAAHFRRIPKQ
jgi:alpha-glucosidase